MNIIPLPHPRQPRVIRFDKPTIEGLPNPPIGSRVYYRAEQDNRLILDVTPDAKVFRLKARLNGRVTWFDLGRFPDTHPADALKRLGDYAAMIRLGMDPRAPKIEARAEPTIGEIWAAYLEGHARPYKRSADQDEATWDRHLKRLRGRLAGSFGRKDAQVLHAKISAEAGPVAANRALVLLRTIYNRARDWELWAGDNPCSRVKLNSEASRDRWILPHEMRPFLSALDSWGDQVIIDMAHWALCTGARKRDIFRAAHRDIDLKGAVWRIPNPKAHGIAAQPHLVPLVGPALDIARRRRGDGGDWLLPGRRFTKRARGHMCEPKRAWLQIAGPDLHIHDLRRTLASWMKMTGADQITVAAMLGHSIRGVTAVYTRTWLEAVREAAQRAVDAMFATRGDHR